MPLHLITGYKGTAHITAEDVGAFNAGTIGSGEYVLATGNQLKAELLSNNTVRILDGDLIIQGRHASLRSGTVEELTINNGNADTNRNDIIVARYTKDSQSGVEDISFAVVQGKSVSGAASDPEIASGDILSGACLLHEMPLYRIPIKGLVAEAPIPLMNKLPGYADHIIANVYTGDGAASKFVNLGFTPSAVFVARNDGSTVMRESGGYGQIFRGGLALKNSRCAYGSYPIVEIVENGFKVFKTDMATGETASRFWIQTNLDGSKYNYIAIR